jgi:hypothetical protein
VPPDLVMATSRSLLVVPSTLARVGAGDVPKRRRGFSVPYPDAAHPALCVAAQAPDAFGGGGAVATGHTSGEIYVW